MGISDEVEKAARESMGRAIDPGSVARASGNGGDGSGLSLNGWFGPGSPLNPVAPKDSAGRAFDYPVAYNLQNRPRAQEEVSFEQLRGLADGYDLLRLIIETRKDQVEGYRWEVRAKEGMKASQSSIDSTISFLEFPDQEHNWNTWLRMLLEELFVIDAIVVYPRLTRGGSLYALELVDGATIKRVIDHTGRTPLPPDTAYQQVLKGLPATDYTRDDLIYWMRNPRVSKVYGYSPVEQIIMTVNTALRRQLHQLQFYTEGNIPESIAGVPDSWTIDDIAKWQKYWDLMIEGNTAQRRHMKFVPFDPSKMQFPKQEVVKDQFDEWLARICCFAFSISPTMLVKDTNRATADRVADTAKEEGLMPLLTWIKRFMDFIIQRHLGQRKLEFVWEDRKSLDPKAQAEVDEIYLRAKVFTVDEVRKNLGRDSLTDKQKSETSPKGDDLAGQTSGDGVTPDSNTYQALIEEEQKP